LEINKNYETAKKKQISAKNILGPLAPRHPWRQVVPNYSQRQDVLRDKLHQAVQHQVGCVNMSHTQKFGSFVFCCFFFNSL